MFGFECSGLRARDPQTSQYLKDTELVSSTEMLDDTPILAARLHFGGNTNPLGTMNEKETKIINKKIK